MKIIAVLSILFYLNCLSDAQHGVHRTEHLKPVLPGARQQSRIKRQALPASSVNEDATCLQQCQQKLLNEITKQRASGNINSGNTLERYCSTIYLPTVSCFDACRQTVYRDLALAQLDIGKFLCIDRKAEATKFYPCIENATISNVDQQCLIGCINNGSYSSNIITNPETKISININCREIRCTTKCQLATVQKLCPADGARFARDYFKYVADTYQKQTDVVQGKGGKLWPQECIDVQSELS